MNELFHPSGERLEALVEGSLQEGDRVVVESHLLGCPQCQTEVEEWRALFAALSSVPQFEPAVGFADRVIPHVRILSRPSMLDRFAAALQGYAARAASVLPRLTPETTLGLSLAAACMALPIVIVAGIAAWLMQQAALTPREVWAFTSSWLVEGVQGIGSSAINSVVQTDVSVWLIARFANIVQSSGMSGLGTLFAVGGITLIVSSWVLYRNLFRTPTREDNNYVSYCF